MWNHGKCHGFPAFLAPFPSISPVAKALREAFAAVLQNLPLRRTESTLVAGSVVRRGSHGPWMVYLWKMVDLSMAMLNNQKVQSKAPGHDS